MIGKNRTTVNVSYELANFNANVTAISGSVEFRKKNFLALARDGAGGRQRLIEVTFRLSSAEYISDSLQLFSTNSFLGHIYLFE